MWLTVLGVKVECVAYCAWCEGRVCGLLFFLLQRYSWVHGTRGSDERAGL